MTLRIQNPEVRSQEGGSFCHEFSRIDTDVWGRIQKPEDRIQKARRDWGLSVTKGAAGKRHEAIGRKWVG